MFCLFVFAPVVFPGQRSDVQILVGEVFLPLTD